MNQAEEKKTCGEEFLAELYKNMKMGSDSILHLMPKVSGSDLRDEMTAQLNRYEELTGRIGEALRENGREAREENVMTKVMSKMGMTVNTMMDATDSHIAQMMIEGATMGITENTKLLRQCENKGCSEQALSLARESIRFMEDTVERLKRYL
jgi:protein-disulfide isomerase-like protein with CxxC motif